MGEQQTQGKGEDGLEWTVRSKFEDELANFMLEKKIHAKRIGDMLVQHRKGLREQYSQMPSAIDKSKTHEPEAPTLVITNRSRISTQYPPFSAPPRPATNSFTEKETEKRKNTEKSSTQEPIPYIRDGRRRVSPDYSRTALPRHHKSRDQRTRRKIEFEGRE
nr:hypothetical protein [Tanacetum cinerariifolium]